MALADLFAEAPPPGLGMAPVMPEQPAPAPAPQPAAPPVAQRSFMGYAAAKQNDPANWVTLANQGATRNLPIGEQLQKNLQTAIAAVYGPGYRAQVYSGGQPALGSGGARVGSTRHDGGNAADLYVLDPQGQRVTGDKLAPLGKHWLENKYGGVGLEMKGGGIHLDVHQNRAPIWTYGPVSPAQAALVEQFGGRATIGDAGVRPLGQPRSSVPSMARAGAPQPVTPGYQMAPPPMTTPDAPVIPPSVGLAQMFALDSQRRAEQARRDEEDAVRARRQALFSGPSPFG